MAAAKGRLLAWMTGAGCSLAGLLATAPCSGPACASCFGCAGAGAGLALALVLKRLAARGGGCPKARV